MQQDTKEETHNANEEDDATDRVWKQRFVSSDFNPILKKKAESWEEAFHRLEERRNAFVPTCRELLDRFAQLPPPFDGIPKQLQPLTEAELTELERNVSEHFRLPHDLRLWFTQISNVHFLNLVPPAESLLACPWHMLLPFPWLKPIAVDLRSDRDRDEPLCVDDAVMLDLESARDPNLPAAAANAAAAIGDPIAQATRGSVVLCSSHYLVLNGHHRGMMWFGDDSGSMFELRPLWQAMVRPTQGQASALADEDLIQQSDFAGFVLMTLRGVLQLRQQGLQLRLEKEKQRLRELEEDAAAATAAREAKR